VNRIIATREMIAVSHVQKAMNPNRNRMRALREKAACLG